MDETLLDNFASIEYQGIAGTRHIAKLKIIAAYLSEGLSDVVILNKAFVKIDFTKIESNTIKYNNKEPLAVSINHFDTPEFRIPIELNKSQFLPKIQSQNLQAVKIDIQEEGIYRIDASQLTGLVLT